MKIRIPERSSQELKDLILQHNARMNELAAAFNDATKALAKIDLAVSVCSIFGELKTLRTQRIKAEEVLFNAAMALQEARKNQPFLPEILEQVAADHAKAREELAAKIKELQDIIELNGIAVQSTPFPYLATSTAEMQVGLDQLAKVPDSVNDFLQHGQILPGSLVVEVKEVSLAAATLAEIRKRRCD